MSGRHKKKQNQGGYKVTVAEMLRDVLLASMNKGQFPLAVLAIIFVVGLWKMPSDSVGKLVFDIAADIKSGYLVGYVLAFASLLGWFFHSKAQRRWYATEIKRMATERTRVQEEKIGAKLPSSEKK